MSVDGVVVEAIGVRVRIVAPEPLAAVLRPAWQHCLVYGPAAVDVVVRSDELGEELSTDELLERITQDVTVRAITARAGELLMLHACAVADPATGAVVVFVGPSGMGKTTVAQTLGRRWRYVTDETAAIDADGRVLPYPKPLSVKLPGHTHKEQVPPQELGLVPATGPLRVTRVALLDRQPAPCDVEVEDIPTVRAVALLAEQTSFLASFDKPLRRLADCVHLAGGAVRVRYAEAADLEPLTERWLREAE